MKTFHIRQTTDGFYLSRQDRWQGDALAALSLSNMADVRHNIRRLRDYAPDIYREVGGASDDTGRFYPLEELCL